MVYYTGVYDSWRNNRSLDQACGGTLAQGGLSTALNSSNLRAKSLDDGEESLAKCFVERADKGADGKLRITLQWSSSEKSARLSYSSYDIHNGARAQAAPVGSGWPGVIRKYGYLGSTVIVAVDCQNQRNKALVASGEVFKTPDGISQDDTVLTGLARVTAETALKAATKHGCKASGGKKLTHVPGLSAGRPGTGKPLKQARGSCAPLRGLREEAAENGTPEVIEYPADALAPQTNCYLLTPSKKPGYGLYAFYGAAAKAFNASEDGASLETGGGPTHDDKDYAWATAECPQSTERALFVLYRLYDSDTDTYPVRHFSSRFAASAVKAFADHEARQRGCTGVKLAPRP
ncbi:hypothetical protein [Streptomyces coffeae]|uniref:Uncharacterized protein n=1 Tax=Streptomyces coffeae TaxID=621382 RepID=A0ABS1N960_9ACTN|nr:hypothetical protein [Streptomyces coffeae]MBL1096620.1 hypothetical protein [Streptomyces coffeae]